MGERIPESDLNKMAQFAGIPLDRFWRLLGVFRVLGIEIVKEPEPWSSPGTPPPGGEEQST